MYKCPICEGSWITATESDEGRLLTCDDCGYQDTEEEFTGWTWSEELQRYRVASEWEQMDLERRWRETFQGGESDE